MKLRFQSGISRRRGIIPSEARPVVVVNCQDTLLNFFRCNERSEYRQIPAFGMSAYHEAARLSLRLPEQIFGGVSLRWNDIPDAEEKVLFPGHYGIVCAAKRHKAHSIRQLDRQHGKLLFPVRVHTVYKVA